jgi:putative transposase
VDQPGNGLDILVTAKRDKQAAQRFFRKLLGGCRYVPWVIITDKWASYGAAKREILPGVEHRQHKGLNNRAENSHQPTRQQERQIRRVKSAGQAQRFLSAFERVRGHFRLSRHKRPAAEYHAQRMQRFESWNEGTGVQMAA